jgi:magnesium-transporting ATPase (P-type)
MNRVLREVLHQKEPVDDDVLGDGVDDVPGDGVEDVPSERLFLTIPIRDVVPGDVVVLKKGVVYCDMVILQGENILLDESALTGESTPVLKTALNSAVRDVVYSRKEHKTNSILAGTEILEIDEDEKNLGLVMTTGSFTGKGELLSEVLSYERHKFKFDDDVKLVLLILLMEAVVLVSLVFIFLNDNWVYSWFYGMF